MRWAELPVTFDALAELGEEAKEEFGGLFGAKNDWFVMWFAAGEERDSDESRHYLSTRELLIGEGMRLKAKVLDAEVAARPPHARTEGE